MTTVELPLPKLDSEYSIEKALLSRRSVRDFSTEPIQLEQLGQLLWACQGITSPHGYRTAPSAGALYPLELYAIVSRVAGIESGIYHYRQSGMKAHYLDLIELGDFAAKLAGCALGQECITGASVNILICSVRERTAVKYGSRSDKYIEMEAGHAAQNVCLQAQSLGLGVATVGAFYEEKIKAAFKLSEEPLYILPVGVPKK